MPIVGLQMPNSCMSLRTHKSGRPFYRRLEANLQEMCWEEAGRPSWVSDQWNVWFLTGNRSLLLGKRGGSVLPGAVGASHPTVHTWENNDGQRGSWGSARSTQAGYFHEVRESWASSLASCLSFLSIGWEGCLPAPMVFWRAGTSQDQV